MQKEQFHVYNMPCNWPYIFCVTVRFFFDIFFKELILIQYNFKHFYKLFKGFK